MKRQIDGIIRLARYKEYLWFVIVTTLLGVAAGKGTFGIPLMAVLVANWLAVGFAFMINDVEDAPDDALDPAKVNRNPVSAGHLSVRVAQAASFSVAVVSAAIYLLLGLWPFIIGVACLAIGHLYSWRRIRLKSIPFVDLASHGLMLAGLQFLAGYFTFTPSPDGKWVFPFLFIVSISLYGELFNEMRDLEGDLKAGVTHTASLLGPRVTHWLMMGLLLIGASCGVITIFFIDLIPAWVIVLLVVLAAILILPPLLKVRRHHTAMELQAPFQVPIQIAGAVALSVWFVGPWLDSLLHLGLF
jgi:4-hydroxybenzoate polyprenyltransferase